MADIGTPLTGDPAAAPKLRTALVCGGVAALIMITVAMQDLVQDKVLRAPYGENLDIFDYPLFPLFFSCIIKIAATVCIPVFMKLSLAPITPMHEYCTLSISGGITSVCLYEAPKFIGVPILVTGECAQAISVMVWGMVINGKTYTMRDYFFAVVFTVASSVFILFPVSSYTSPQSAGGSVELWGLTLLLGFLGFSGFSKTYQERLFRGFDMMIHNQILYSTLCTCFLSLSGLILKGHLVSAIKFMFLHEDCFFDVLLFSTLATVSQFLISFTVKTYGALTLALIMTTKLIASIMVSCVWLLRPLTWEQWVSGVVLIGGISVYAILALQKPDSPPREANQVKAPRGYLSYFKSPLALPEDYCQEIGVGVSLNQEIGAELKFSKPFGSFIDWWH